MIEFQTPAKIVLEDGRHLFSGISHIGGRLILVGIHYFDRPILYDAVGIRILAARTQMPAIERYIRTEYEPCVVLAMTVGEEPFVLEISYEGKTWQIAPNRETIRESRLSAMTLFKEDYRLIPAYVDHYVKLGVRNFRLYYNGALASVDWGFLKSSPRLANAHVTLVEWDVPYWWTLSRKVGEPTYDEQGFQHHAQIMAMNHHLHAVKQASTHTYFVDLDEFVFTPKHLLDFACSCPISSVQLECWWASPEGLESYDTFSLDGNERRLIIAERSDGPYRHKSLARTAAVDLMGIHYPHVHSGEQFFFWDGFFHIFRFAENDRSSGLHLPVRLLTKSRFLHERFGEYATGFPAKEGSTAPNPPLRQG